MSAAAPALTAIEQEAIGWEAQLRGGAVQADELLAFDAWLARSLEARRFSRGERQALAEFVATLATPADRDAVVNASGAKKQPDLMLVGANWLVIAASQHQLDDVTAMQVKLGGFIVPRADEHQSEYVPPHAERLSWLTGFTGSAGTAVVLADKAALVVDGRYKIGRAHV